MPKAHNYLSALNARFWAYHQKSFDDRRELFERPYAPGQRPPVFLKETAYHNVLVRPGASEEELQLLQSLIPVTKWHRWFRSMTSSQALAQSVLGNLKVMGKLPLLKAVMDEESGLSLFGEAPVFDKLELEKDVSWLGEPVSTSLDGFIGGDGYRVAVECKLTEPEIGPCSRARMRPSHKRYEALHCDGSYKKPVENSPGCVLLREHPRIAYWTHIPALFNNWVIANGLTPCPLKDNYQLVRNILAACVRGVGDKTYVDADHGHAVLLYDDRNPAFQTGGKAFQSFQMTRSALFSPTLLRKASWQTLIGAINLDPDLAWLVELLKAKYGLLPHGTD